MESLADRFNIIFDDFNPGPCDSCAKIIANKDGIDLSMIVQLQCYKIKKQKLIIDVFERFLKEHKEIFHKIYEEIDKKDENTANNIKKILDEYLDDE